MVFDRAQTDAARRVHGGHYRPGAARHRRRAAAARIEPALVERLLAETAEGADALPLLALTLERLYRDFGDDGDLTVAEYESMGGMAQVVQTEVDKLLAADPRAAPSPARHPARCVHPVAGHHQPRQRPADAPPGPLG